jgi:hypothetical protein
MSMNQFNPDDKVRFKEEHSDCLKKFIKYPETQTLTVLWSHNENECGQPGGIIKIKEFQERHPHHSINPSWLELAKRS